MKKTVVTIVTLITFCCMSFAQEVSHLPLSKGLPGIWQQAVVRNQGNGASNLMRLNNYKVMNTDGTYFGMISVSGGATVIAQYGTYEITSDSTFIERIADHSINPSLKGKESTLRYRFVDANTMFGEYWDSVSGAWIPELWIRVSFPKKQEDNFI